jgi:DNA-binding CsgD family transcriptional regulator/PAS domain-containing protein
MARSEFYHDYLWPNGLGYVGATSLKADSGSIVGLAIHRSRPQRPFELQELDFLDRLAPHLLRTLRLQTRMTELEAQHWADRALCDRLPFAVLLLDERGRVVSLNEAAVRLLAAGDGLTEGRGRLFAAHSADQAPLDHLMNAVATAQQRGTEGGGIVALRRPTARRPLAATVLPIPRRGGALSIDLGASHPVVLVIITDPDAARNPPAAVLRRLYGLTPAEAALAHALAAGRSLQECADEMGLTTETARWRLKRILAKTHTHRQSSPR